MECRGPNGATGSSSLGIFCAICGCLNFSQNSSTCENCRQKKKKSRKAARAAKRAAAAAAASSAAATTSVHTSPKKHHKHQHPQQSQAKVISSTNHRVEDSFSLSSGSSGASTPIVIPPPSSSTLTMRPQSTPHHSSSNRTTTSRPSTNTNSTTSSRPVTSTSTTTTPSSTITTMHKTPSTNGSNGVSLSSAIHRVLGRKSSSSSSSTSSTGVSINHPRHSFASKRSGAPVEKTNLKRKRPEATNAATAASSSSAPASTLSGLSGRCHLVIDLVSSSSEDEVEELPNQQLPQQQQRTDKDVDNHKHKHRKQEDGNDKVDDEDGNDDQDRGKKRRVLPRDVPEHGISQQLHDLIHQLNQKAQAARKAKNKTPSTTTTPTPTPTRTSTSTPESAPASRRSPTLVVPAGAVNVLKPRPKSTSGHTTPTTSTPPRAPVTQANHQPKEPASVHEKTPSSTGTSTSRASRLDSPLPGRSYEPSTFEQSDFQRKHRDSSTNSSPVNSYSGVQTGMTVPADRTRTDTSASSTTSASSSSLSSATSKPVPATSVQMPAPAPKPAVVAKPSAPSCQAIPANPPRTSPVPSKPTLSTTVSAPAPAEAKPSAPSAKTTTAKLAPPAPSVWRQPQPNNPGGEQAKHSARTATPPPVAEAKSTPKSTAATSTTQTQTDAMKTPNTAATSPPDAVASSASSVENGDAGPTVETSHPSLELLFKSRKFPEMPFFSSDFISVGVMANRTVQVARRSLPPRTVSSDSSMASSPQKAASKAGQVVEHAQTAQASTPIPAARAPIPSNDKAKRQEVPSSVSATTSSPGTVNAPQPAPEKTHLPSRPPAPSPNPSSIGATASAPSLTTATGSSGLKPTSSTTTSVSTPSTTPTRLWTASTSAPISQADLPAVAPPKFAPRASSAARKACAKAQSFKSMPLDSTPVPSQPLTPSAPISMASILKTQGPSTLGRAASRKRIQPMQPVVKKEVIPPPQPKTDSQAAKTPDVPAPVFASTSSGTSNPVQPLQVLVPLVGQCTPGFLFFMKHITNDGDDDDDEDYGCDPHDDGNNSLTPGERLSGVIDLTSISDDESSEEDVTPETSPTNQSQHEGNGPTMSNSSASLSTKPALKLYKCEICGESSALGLRWCQTCKKYQHVRCARDCGDENKCWVCDLDQMIDDSDLTEQDIEQTHQLLDALRSGDLPNLPPVDPDKDETDSSGQEPGVVASFVAKSRSRTTNRWKYFLEHATADLDDDFETKTRQIQRELQCEQNRQKYSRGFAKQEEVVAQMNQLLDAFAKRQEEEDEQREKARLQRLRDEAAVAAAAAAAAAATLEATKATGTFSSSATATPNATVSMTGAPPGSNPVTAANLATSASAEVLSSAAQIPSHAFPVTDFVNTPPTASARPPAPHAAPSDLHARAGETSASGSAPPPPAIPIR